MKEESKTLSVVVPASVKDRLEKVAEEEERNVSWIVRKAIQEYLEKRG